VKTPLRVLIVEDSERDAELNLNELQRADYEPTFLRVETPEAMSAALAAEPWDVILSDWHMPRFNAPAALAVLKKSGLNIPFIIVSGTIGEMPAVQAMKEGAHDYIMKDRLERLGPAVAREIREAEVRHQHRLSQEALRTMEARYRRLFEMAKDGILILDADTGMIMDANPFLIELLGFSRDQFLGKAIWDLGFFKDIVANQANFLELQKKGYIRYENLALETAAGRRIEVEFVSNVYLVNHRKVVQCNISDITERKQAERQIRRTKEEWERTFDAVPDSIALIDTDHRITRVNQAMVARLGKTFQQVVGCHCYEVVHGLSAPPDFCPHSKLLVSGKEERAEVMEERLGGIFDVTATPLRNETGQLVGCVHVARDITKRRKAEAELWRTNRALRVITACNEVLVRADEETPLLNDICRLIVEIGGYHFAWVGFAESDEKKTVRPAAHAGDEKDYLKSARISWADDETGRGPTGMAIRTGKPAVVDDIRTDPRYAPWRAEVAKRGYRSSAALPLVVGDAAIGALNVYSEFPNAFSGEEVRLLMELANNLAYGIRALRVRAAHVRAEKELQFRNVILSTQQEASLDGILVVDENARIVSYNRRFIEMWGIPPELVENKDDEPVLRFVTGKAADPQSFFRRVQYLYEHRQETGRDEIPLKSGSVFDRYSAPMLGADGRYFGRVWYFRDVTERKRAELALQRVNRALKVTSGCNGMLIRATEESALLRDVCQLLVAGGGYDSAWVGFVERKPKRVGPPVAFAGRGREQTVFAARATDPGEWECRPANVAIRTGKPCVVQCGENERNLDPWQVRMRQAGYASAAAFPLFGEGHVLGVLSMYAENAETFAADEMRLLSEMADDLAFGIQTIRARAAHAKAVETLRENEERYHHLFESLYDAAFLADGKTGIILDANRQAEVLLGKSRDEIIGSHQSELHPPAQAQAYGESFDAAATQASSVTEAEVLGKDGAIVPVSISTSKLTVGGVPLVLGLFRDITAARQAGKHLRDSALKLQQMMEGTVKAMGSALEARDPYTAGHERRVAELAFAIAGEMGLDEGKSEGIRIAGYVHDIGKIAVPAEILSKPGKISEFEFGIIRTHPQFGHDILKEIDFVWPVAQTTLQHHERLDGSGYPQKLQGDQIIVEARILAVADVVEAMSSHRPYRAALGIAMALEEITQKKGTLYDPLAVEACVKLFREEGFQFA